MKIRFERGDTAFEVEKDPMPPERFKVVCALAGAGIYAGMVIGVAALCGGSGLLLALLGTVFVAAVVKGFE